MRKTVCESGDFLLSSPSALSQRLLCRTLNASHKWNAAMQEPYEIHCHSFYELYYFVSGHVRYMVEGVRYDLSPHTLLLMAPTVLHGISFLEEGVYERYVIQFAEEEIPAPYRAYLLQPFLYRENEGQIGYSPVPEQTLIPGFENLLACARLSPDEQETEVSIALPNLLLQVRRLYRDRGICPSLSLPKVVSDALAFLNLHLSDPFSLSDVAAFCFVSEHQLGKLFRESMGTSVMQYVSRKRTITAQQYIKSGTSAQEAARLCGFRDYSVFFRTYKKILGHTPAEDLR
ncbi:MAG: AraC family transcriptional regulator [Clostridia bacterium]|nr:AraC family transcriptional regulator [Clostridia bacterium]MDY5558977.1 AraC family transcriptional regulator [Candidatus Heritagella sp.]